MTTTAPDPTREQSPAPTVDLAPDRRWPRTLLLALCLAAVLAAAVRVAVHDPTELPVSGDQSAFVYQAISIAGGNLSFDPADQEEWVELDWGEQPRGLFMQKRDADYEAWAFAKPYGYSVLIAPFLAWFGPYGITFVGGLLLLAYAGCWYGIGRTRWRPAGAALVAAVATIGSNAWPMAFPAHADLFVAVLVGLAALASVRLVIGGRVDASDGSRGPELSKAWTVAWAIVGAATAGVLVTEKMPALVVVGPLLALGLWRSPMRARIAAVGVGAVVVAVSVVPYLVYSDGASWNAYGGDRYYAAGRTPWSGGTIDDLTPWRTAESMSPSRVLDRLEDPADDLPSAALTYVVGRHTGAVTHQPVIAALGVAALVAVVRRRRRTDDDPDQATIGEDDPADRARWSRWALIASAGGLAAYVVLYLVSFTDNYFGGGQSVGNRYFLQVSAMVAVIPIAARVTERAAMWAALVGGIAAAVLITPHLFQPDEAFYHLERTSPVQELLPFDGSQSGNWRFECDPDVDCVPPPLAPYPG